LAGWLGFMRGNVLVMTTCECVWRTSIDMIWPFLSLYVVELGGSYETVGFIMATASLAGVILYPLGGYIADYQGRIKLIGYMTLAYGMAFLIPAFTGTWQWLAVGMFLQNLVMFYFPARQALMADSLPPSQRGVGFAAMDAIPGAFGIATPVLGAWLIGVLGMGTAMRGLYLSGFFIAVTIAVFRLRFLKETLTDPRTIDASPKGVLRLIAESYRSSIHVLKNVPKGLWTLSLLVTSSVFFVSVASSFWIIRATQVIGLSIQQWAVIMLLSGLVSVSLGIPVGRLIDRLSKRRIAGACLLLEAVLAYLFTVSSTFEQVAALAIASTLTDTFMNPSLLSLFADLTPRNLRGRVLASIGGGGFWLMRGAWGGGTLVKIVQTMGALLSGYVYTFNSSLPWFMMSASLAVIGAVFLVTVKDPERAEL